MDRPFKVIGICHVAIVVADKARTRWLWEEILGGQQTSSFISASENVEESIYMLGVGRYRQEIDLIEPINSIQAPQQARVNLNHIALWVDNLQSAVKWMEAKGKRFTPGGIRKGSLGHEVCFIHPKASATCPVSGEGVLIELVQAPNDVLRLSHTFGLGNDRS